MIRFLAGITQHFYSGSVYTIEANPKGSVGRYPWSSGSQTKKSQEKFGRSSFLCLTLILWVQG
jgi:hypothetical protein